MAEEKETKSADEAPAEDFVTEEEPKLKSAGSIITTYAAAASAAGLIPIPVVDMTAIAGIQLKMVHSLSRLYGIPFSHDWAKSVLASLTGSVASEGLGRFGLASALKLIPGVGHVASLLAMPGMAFMATSVVGQIFTQHFESGGTLLNLNLKVWRPIYEEKVKTEANKN